VRSGTVIKGEAVPALLCQHRNTVFVTTNVSDFWRRVPAHARYCVVCAPLPTQRQDELPGLLQRLLRHDSFRTDRLRMGKVIRVSESNILYYKVGRSFPARVDWPESRRNPPAMAR
jgi:hypothetical protein